VDGRHGEQQIEAINKVGLLAPAMSQSILGRVDEWRHLVPGKNSGCWMEASPPGSIIINQQRIVDGVTFAL